MQKPFAPISLPGVPFALLHRDTHLLVIDKPAGLGLDWSIERAISDCAHQSHIAAVRIKEQEFFQARPRHRFPQTAPLLDDRGGRKAHRAVIRQML